MAQLHGTGGTTTTEVIRAPEVPRTTPYPYCEKWSLALDVRRRSAEESRSQFDSFFGCQLPPAPRNGFAIVSRNKNRLVFFRERGFRPTSAKPMTCNGRVWIGTPPRCLNGTDSPQDDVSLETLRPNPCGSDYGGCAHMCLYGPDHRHTCICQSGFLKNGTKCIDRDECAEGRRYCDEGCVNTPGSYRCQCPDGYDLGRDHKSCLDIDECQANNGGCQEECINHIGSFSCRCKSPAYSLTANGKTCVAVTCPPLTPPEHGYIVGECATTYLGKCVFECDEGFELTAQGSEIRTCQGNGTWSGVTSQCVVKRCGEPPTPVDGYVKDCQEDRAVGTSCTICCIEGYRLVGESTTVCTSSKTWTVAEPICNLVQCPSPASLTSTARFLEHGLNRTYVYKDTFWPTCLSGFRLRGPRLILCGANGQWEAVFGQSTLFNCVDKEEPVVRCPDNVTLSVGAGQSHATVAWSQPEATDDSGVLPEIQQDPQNIVSPWRFPIGQTAIRFRATDAAWLWTECTFTVTVMRE